MKQLQHVIIEYTHLLPTAATATAIPAATCENVSAVISDRTTTPGSIKSLKDKKIKQPQNFFLPHHLCYVICFAF